MLPTLLVTVENDVAVPLDMDDIRVLYAELS
jgi:hypothetical protein